MGRPTSRRDVGNGGSSSGGPPFGVCATTLTVVAAAALVALATGCSTKQATENTYFDRTISPIIQDSCVHTNTGANCHFTQPKGNAIGNLSLESYDDLIKRRDLLVNYGPYGLPNMLLKNVDSFDLLLTAYDGKPITVKTDIRHSGVKIVGLTTAGFNTIKNWIQGGANKNNAITPPIPVERDPCTDIYPSDPAFQPGSDPATADFQEFKANVQPIVGDSCAAGNCHGSPTNSLRFVCATGANTDVLARWNYFAATAYLATTPEGLGGSEILRRPLDPQAGGAYHEGGVIFASQMDDGYVKLLAWAKSHGPNMSATATPGFEFFAKRVQPMLIKKGCMILGCHSPAMFHDYRLRAGSGGNFSLPTTRTNYELTRAQIAMESPDPGASRLIAKNLVRPDEQVGGRGILHRGGALLDDFGVGLASPAACMAAPGNDPDAGPLDMQHAYCVIARWIQIEQTAAKLQPLSGMVYVKKKPVGPPDLPQDFANYSGGADLCFSPLTSTADAMTGMVTIAGGGACTSLLAGCAGLSAATADIRHPTVSWKADKIAFAARNSAAEPYAIWTANIDATGAASACAKEAVIAATPTAAGWTDNGAPIHNFDPAFTPDDRLVFASTRGNVMNTEVFDYHGPTHTPADPTRWNANLYILESGKVRQLTFLLNQEFLPSMMSDGRLIFSAEKRAPNFYQLAGRRMNLDGGDYHPLFGQRRTIGFDQMTEVVELANKNLAAIFSDQKAAHGAGTLGLVNRSLGPDQLSQDPADYVSDPNAIGWPAPNFYVHSLHLPDGAATGHTGAGNVGAYRSPAPLPNGNILVSYAANAMDIANFTGNFDIYVVDEITGAKTQVTNDAANDELFPVAVYQRMDRSVFKSRTDEANANTRVYTPGEDANHPTNVSDITILNAQILGGLIFQNTRTGLENSETGRAFPALNQLEVYEDLPPNGDIASFSRMDAYGSVFAHRRLLGNVGVLGDGSARMVVPGGVPLVLRGAFTVDGTASTPLYQREEMQFYPGEYSHQGFQQGLFNGLCGGCHGSVSGRDVDLALQPDILTQASRVQARDVVPSIFGAVPSARGPDGPTD
jgi:hypothetical protein